MIVLDEVLNQLITDIDSLEVDRHAYARNQGLCINDGDDIRQTVCMHVLETCQNEPGLAQHILDMPEAERFRLIRGLLDFTAGSLRRDDHRQWRRGPGDRDHRYRDVSPLDAENARRIIDGARSGLDREGRFALEVMIRDVAPETLAPNHGITAEQAAIWLVEGNTKLAKLIARLLKDQVGPRALKRFHRLVRIFRRYFA